MRKLHFYSQKKQRGYLLIVAVIMIAIVGFIGTAISSMFFGSSFSTTAHYKSGAALYLAQSGLEHATHKLLAPTLTRRLACSGLSITNTLGSGAYQVTSSGPIFVASAALSGALTAAATTIPVTSTAGYQSSGRIMLDRELINYSGVTATSFLGAIRGVDGTTAAAHNATTPAGQYQCNLTSTGGVPSLTPPANTSGVRTLTEGVQLQEAWAVGNVGTAGSFNFARWNDPTELNWTNASAANASAVSLNGVSMVSYADVWAVGATRTFVHWDGATWTAQRPAAIPNVTLQSVYCSNGDDCHAVGAASGGSPVIGHWNGTAWTRMIPSPTVGVNLNAVRCVPNNPSACWAVGASGTRVFFWNGTVWARVTVALTTTTFQSVYCNSVSDCWAVGNNSAFAYYNGVAWANDTVAQRGAIPNTTYNSVYCNSTSDCWAVGLVNGGNALIVHWNGTVWARDVSLTPAVNANLQEVRCANANDCWAVGAIVGTQPAVLHYDGASWVKVTTTGLQNAILFGLAIVSPSTEPWSASAESFP